MIKTHTSRFRQDLHPKPLNLEKIFQDFEGMVIDNEIIRNSRFQALVSDCVRNSIGYRVTGPAKISPEQKAAYLLRAAREGAPDAVRMVQMGYDLMNQRMPEYLQLMQEGELIYLPSLQLEQDLIDSMGREELTGDLFAGRAYEIIFRNPRVCRLMSRFYSATTGKTDLEKVSLESANVSLAITSHTNHESRPYRHLSFEIFTPKGKGTTGRGVTCHVFEDTIENSGIEEALSEAVREVNPELQASELSVAVDFLRLTLHASSEIASGKLAISDAINPRATLKARAANASLPKKQRDRAKAMIHEAAGAPIRAVLADGDEPVVLKDLLPLPENKQIVPAWAPAVEYNEEMALSENPRERNLHGQMHPQTITRTFPGIGENGAVLAVEADKAREVVKAEAEAPSTPPPGSEGIAMDRMQLDIPPRTMPVINELLTIYQAAVLSVEIEQRPTGLKEMRGMLDMHEALTDYHRSGNQCFMLNGEVSRMMMQTDISAIPVTDIKLPFSALYLTFDEPVEMNLDGEHAVFEGAYLSGSFEEISILMAFSPLQKTGSPFADFRAPLKITLPRLPGFSLEDAILEAVSSGGYDLEKDSALEITEEMQTAAGAMGTALFGAEKTSQTELAERNERLFGTMVEAVTIVANSIMAMTSGPDEIVVQETWGNVSDETRFLLNAPSSKGRERGRKAAQQENAMPVRVISLSAEAKARHREDADKVRKSPEEAYWRRGHWRRQPYGKGLALRRWVWIEPKLCNADAELKRAGSVYTAEADSSELEP